MTIKAEKTVLVPAVAAIPAVPAVPAVEGITLTLTQEAADNIAFVLMYGYAWGYPNDPGEAVHRVLRKAGVDYSRTPLERIDSGSSFAFRRKPKADAASAAGAAAPKESGGCGCGSKKS